MAQAYATAIITGASSGIGWELAKLLAKEGTKVGLLARRLDKLEELAGEIHAAGGTAFVAAADVGQRGPTVAALKSLCAQLGPVDLLIANAGVGAPTLVEPFNADQQETMVRVNLLGVIYSLEAVLDDMLKRGRGHVAAVSSLAAYKGLPGEGGYCCTKAAVNAYMDSLRVQLRQRGIVVTTICPGFIATPMTAKNEFKMPWLMNADEAARRIVWALKRGTKVYNFPMPTRFLMRVASWLPDWLLARVMGGYNQKMPVPERM